MTNKLRVLSTLLLCMIASVGWAETVTFTAGTDKGESLVVKDDITVSMSTMNRDDNYRCNANTNMTVYGKEGITITKIEITCTGSGTNTNGPGKFSLKEGSPGEYSYSGSLGTWVGSSTINNKIYLTAAAQVRMTQIVVTYEVATPAYTITAQSNNTSYGTVSLNGSVISGSPNNGYRYADPAYTVDPANSATVVQDDNEFTVTPSANTTVTINFEAIPTFTVTLGDDNSTLTETIGGAGVTLPSRSTLNGYEFAGWSTTNVATETTTAPTIIEAGAYAPTADITLYPVYTKTVGAGGTTNKTASVTISDYAGANQWENGTQYKTVTLDDNITATASGKSNTGKYYTTGNSWRIYSSESGKLILNASNGAEFTSATISFSNSTLSFGGNAITSGSPVSLSGTSAEFAAGGTTYITAISVSYAISGAGTTYYWSAPVAAAVEIPSIVIAENPFLFSTTATITCATEDATIEYSFDGENWSDYSSALTITETKTIYARAIKGENESDVTQVTATKNLATPSVTISGDLTLDLDGETNVNAGTLTATVTYNDAAIDGATVTWSSNKPEVATIDETTGVVTIKTPGSVTFTATYAGNSDYAEVTATKTVTVIDNNAPGSKGNPYSVANAINAIDNGGNVTNVYVSGKVSQVDEYLSNYKSITYWISDDGTTERQLECYSGKGLNSANFSSINEIQVGDIVTVVGTLKKYNGVYEFNYNNYLVSQQHPKHMVTWMVNGEEKGTSEIEAGSALTYETPADILGKAFVGWMTETIDGETDEAPTLVTSMPNEDITLYAVYAKKEGTSENASVTIDKDTEGIPTSYGTANTFTEYTLNGTKFMIQQMYKNGDKLQWRAGGNNSGTGTLYNVDELQSIKSIVLTYDDSDTNKNFTVNIGNTENPTSGTAVTPLTNENVYTFNCSSQNCSYFVLANGSGAGYLTSFTINYVASSVTYSDYCTMVVAPVKPAKPIVFHDGGEGVTYEGELTVPMFAEEGATIYYTTDGSEPDVQNAEQAYSGPVSLPVGETTVKAIAVKNGMASDVVEKVYTIIPVQTPDIVDLDGYYSIQNNEGNYVNVAGRKTVTFVNEATSMTAAGTVIKVKTTNGKVDVLRSQAVDVPGYAKRAMNYVPNLVTAIVERMGENNVIGEQGLNTLADEFKEKFDYNLYLEEAGDGYRIYGKTPSMQLVVDFYAENKEVIDGRLPYVEGFVKDILLRVADKLGHPNSEWASKFKIHDIWALIVSEENKLTEPVDEVSTAKFYTEVLSSEANIWNFAHETMMIYWDKVMEVVGDKFNGLGDYGKYLEKVPNILPNFKYYIVSDGSGIDFISEGNEDIINNAARTVWTLTPRTEFDVTFLKDNALSSGRELYTTLYTDFAYELPDGVKAYAITGVNETTGFATKEEISGIIAAQTPVLLQATFDAEQTADQTKTLTLRTEAGTTPETNLLVGADELINQYMINSSTAVTLLDMLSSISQSLAGQYSYLARKNAGTVNNKYFFALDNADLDLCTYKLENGSYDCIVRSLSTGNEKVGFYNNWEAKANQAFLINEINPVKLFLKGDIDRDGDVDNNDLKALVEIVLEKVTVVNNPDDYDFEAAHVNDDEDIDIADVTALVNILNTLQTQTNN